MYSIGSMFRLKCSMKYSGVWELPMENSVFQFSFILYNMFNNTSKTFVLLEQQRNA